MRYGDATAFRQALEQRLKTSAAGDGARLARDRKRVAFERLLARLVATAPEQWVLKGGFALDLRMPERARSTRDVDIEWHDATEKLLDSILRAAAHDAGDFFVFDIERTSDSENRFGGSRRFRVASSLAGRLFETFPLDVGFRDRAANDSTQLRTSDILAFSDIAPVKIAVLSLELHVAEKTHAYTRVYEGSRLSTRVKDLVDLALIAADSRLDAEVLANAIDSTFAQRATHDVPQAFARPPQEWRVPFRQLAGTVGIAPDIETAHATVAELLDPVLRHEVPSGYWNPEARRWTPSE